MSLSNTQARRLGTLLRVMFKEDTPDTYLSDVVAEGYVDKSGDQPTVTEKGLDEKNRLCTLAGLNIKYKSELT